jgi:hypothetical protein
MQSAEAVDYGGKIVRRCTLDEVMAAHPPRQRLFPGNCILVSGFSFLVSGWHRGITQV